MAYTKLSLITTVADDAPQGVGSVAAAGISSLASRADHVHVGVQGPASATAGAMAKFNGTTGKVLTEAVAGTDYALPFVLKAVVTGGGTTMASWDSQPVNPTGGAFAITTPASPANGDLIRIRNISASVNTVTVTANSGQTIEGAATYPVGGAYFSVEFCYYTVGALWTCIRQG